MTLDEACADSERSDTLAQGVSYNHGAPDAHDKLQKLLDQRRHEPCITSLTYSQFKKVNHIDKMSLI
jgi:hypothetical protein